MSTPYYVYSDEEKRIIAICAKSNDLEIIKWREEDWAMHPNLVFDIFDAITLALTDPREFAVQKGLS